jgi:hypothetical protein
MSVSLIEKARHNRLIALRAIQIRKSGSDRVALFPCADREADRIMFSSRRTHNPMHNLFVAA